MPTSQLDARPLAAAGAPPADRQPLPQRARPGWRSHGARRRACRARHAAAPAQACQEPQQAARERGAAGCEAFGRRRALLAAAAALAALQHPPRPAHAALVDEEAAQRVYAAAAPSVVTITNSRLQNGVPVDDAAGSGFVWDARGYIVTNYHCIQGPLRDSTGAEFVLVKLGDGSGPQQALQAEVVGTDAANDLAVLRVDPSAAELPAIQVARSAADLRVGQAIFALGSPAGLSKTLSAGVVSGLNRGIPTPGGGIATRAIQTDAAVSAGNSGGPLLDSSGRLVGVCTATFNSNKSKGRGSGVNFGISVDTVREVVPNLIVYGNASGKGVGARSG